MPLLPREPYVDIQDRDAGRITIRIEHYGQVPDLRLEFSPEVLRQAVNKWRRTTREDNILTAARRLSPTAYRIIESHLIRERALAVEHKLAVQARRASWSLWRANEPQEGRVDEHAAFDPQRGPPARGTQTQEAEPDRVPDAPADGWWDVLTKGVELPTLSSEYLPETLTAKARRELAEEKSRTPKASRGERKAIQRAMDERDESHRDLVEFKPGSGRRQTAIDRAMAETKAGRAKPERQRDRDRSR